MMTMKDNPEWVNSAHTQLPTDRYRVRTLVLCGLSFVVVLLLSPSTQAAQLDCLVKPEMYVELSSPVDSVLETILVDTGDVAHGR